MPLRVCVCMEREQRSTRPSTIFIFTSIHEHLTPCCVCAFAWMCVCVQITCLEAHCRTQLVEMLFFFSVVTESLLWSHCNPIIKQWCTFYHAGLAEVFIWSVSNQRTWFFRSSENKNSIVYLNAFLTCIWIYFYSDSQFRMCFSCFVPHLLLNQ